MKERVIKITQVSACYFICHCLPVCSNLIIKDWRYQCHNWMELTCNFEHCCLCGLLNHYSEFKILAIFWSCEWECKIQFLFHVNTFEMAAFCPEVNWSSSCLILLLDTRGDESITAWLYYSHGGIGHEQHEHSSLSGCRTRICVSPSVQFLQGFTWSWGSLCWNGQHPPVLKWLIINAPVLFT